MKIFISGGCKNGKSTYAQRLAFAQKPLAHPLYYLATMEPSDDEDRERICRHVQERHGMGFETYEIPRNISSILTQTDKYGSFLLDSTTALLANEMFSGSSYYPHAVEKLEREYEHLFRELSNLVIVSDYLFADGCSDKTTVCYMRSLARLDRLCASLSHVVMECCYGNVIFHKGREQLKNCKEMESIVYSNAM